MKIIDAHIHLGDCRVFDMNITEDQLMEAIENAGIDAAIVQPFPGANDCKEVHDRIYQLSKKYPGKIFGLASVNPHIDKNEYVKEVTRCVKDLGFVGVKLHTIGHAVNPMSRDAHVIYETARQLGVPVLIHTGPGVPFALPSLVISPARQYPDVKFVLAHAGASIFTCEAVVAAQTCKNVYLELSWVHVEETIGLLSAVPSNQLMYASDSLKNTTLELEKFRVLDLTEQQKIDIHYQTAKTVYNLPV